LHDDSRSAIQRSIRRPSFEIRFVDFDFGAGLKEINFNHESAPAGLAQNDANDSFQWTGPNRDFASFFDLQDWMNFEAPIKKFMKVAKFAPNPLLIGNSEEGSETPRPID